MGGTPARVVAAAVLAWGLPLTAQSLAVSPTLVEIAPGKHGAVIEVTNNSVTPVDIQIRPYDWSETGSRDVLTDSSTLRVSPSIATIAPGATQLVRMLVPPGDRNAEHDWRILLDQLPRPAEGGGLQIKLRLSIPVFAYATKTATSDLRWTLAGGQLTATNAGPRYVRFAALAVRNANGHETTLALGETPYLLPGAQRQWPVAAATPREVVGRIGTVDFSAPISLDQVR